MILPPSVTRFSRREPLLLAMILAGFALRLYRLGADSLWYDETVSAFLAAESVPDLIAHTTRDIHPPGYYLLLHFWTLAAGHSEFALAFFSLIFGVLIIPLTYRLARILANNSVAIWAALLVAVSPYHLWYSQEVRMYTLGATLGLITAYCFWQVLCRFPPPQKIWVYWVGYALSATLGLYTLYYFAFLLIAINFSLPLASFPVPSHMLKIIPFTERLSKRNNFPLFSANILIFLAYLPWLPTAWRQITYPPVPPWRTFDNFALWPAMLESWSALLLGQSVEPQMIWPILLIGVALFYLGFRYLNGLTSSSFFSSRLDSFITLPTFFLLTYTFGPLLLILYLSVHTPLYHVRYLFTYSPAFYIILAAGLAWLLARRWAGTAIAAASLLLLACFFSIYQYHFDPRYRPDDYRAAVDFIERHWRPGDVILVNAGYVYTAYLYYTDLPNLQRQRLVPYSPAETNRPLLLQTGSVDGSPQLGWGDPRSDFYSMSAADTRAALDALSHDFSRLWLLRAYDTVTDPAGLIRAWLAEQTIPLEDQAFAGESSIRAQGFLLPGAKSLPPGGQTVQFEDGLALASWSLPEQTWQPEQTIPVKLWWQVDSQPSVDYKMSLKLWTPTAQLAAQGQDTWPVGTLYRATAWPTGEIVYQADQITLPADLRPGQYWLNVELYHPDTGLPLPRLDGADPVVTLGPITVEK
ncbi:MAG: glycosyltransferase family 39 protein [Anaerolineae bacterium]|nr:glycosyltransferase family 39 protein [Anaerolineae bacterium]